MTTKMRKLSLISGSRSLADGLAKESWAKDLISEAVSGLGLDDGVLTGACPRSPDEWAGDLALARGVLLVEFALDGERYHDRQRHSRWAAPNTDINPVTKARWPLYRNDNLCLAAAKARSHGVDVTVHAFIDPKSRTQGTGYTANKAEEMGLVVKRHVFEEVTEGYARPDLIFLDCETTGLAKTDDMIELGFIRTDFRAEEVLDRWESKIALEPGMSVHPEAARVNGYTPEAWATARSASTVMAEFLSLLPDRFTLVCHNTPFDQGHLRRAISRLGLLLPGWTASSRDTKRMARTVLKTELASKRLESCSLMPLCDYFAISNTGAHGAMADCERTLELYRCLLRATSEAWTPGI